MYQALYRKWRPRTFSDVCGQETVTAALKNELKNGRLSHAYLFTGCRGTGKTTCAKILAKAVNCEHPENGDPCNECAICRGIDDGSVLDVTEIDAASNNGVGDIRDLRDEVAYTPVAGKYRVYIIDEVHMLSAGAFNALLKTLEEPPAHVIFVLATTEVHKIPATILSRCQRFDFNRIKPEVIADRMRYVAREEGLTLTDDAALLLARLADGAMRDALSLLDQCASGNDTVDAAVVAQVTGMAGQEAMAALTDCVVRRDVPGALAQIDRLYQSSKDMERLCSEWIGYWRNLMVLGAVRDPGDLIVAAPEDLERMRQVAAATEPGVILHALEVLQNTLDRLRGGVSRRVEMEMAVLRLCDPRLDGDTAALTRRIAALENAVRAGMPVATVSTAAPVAPVSTAAPIAETPAPAVTSTVTAVPATPEVPPVTAAPAPETKPETAAPEAAEQPFPQWSEVLECLRGSCMPLYGVLADSEAYLADEKLILRTDNAMFKQLFMQENNKELLKAAIRQVAGREYRLVMRSRAPAVKEDNDPLAGLLNRFGDAGIPIKEI